MSDEARRAGRRWGLAIVGGLASVVVVNFWVWWLVKDEPVALVTERYYEASLRYDEVIAASRRFRAAGLELRVEDDGRVRLLGERAAAVTGPTLRYARPNDPAMDITTGAAPDASGAWVPATAPAAPGRWDVSVVAWLDAAPLAAAVPWYRAP